MSILGAFRDDYYNAISALSQTQSIFTTQASGTLLPASAMCGSADCYVFASTQAAANFTTDSAVNIIAQLQIAVAAAYKQGLGAFAAGVSPPNGVPNLFNVTWTLTINNQNSGTLSIFAGTGVTLSGFTTVATLSARVYQITVTSPTTITMQGLYSYLASP